MPAGKVKAYTRLLRAMFKGQFKATLVRRGDWLPVAFPAYRASLPLVQFERAVRTSTSLKGEPGHRPEPPFSSSASDRFSALASFSPAPACGRLALRQSDEPALRQNLRFGRQLSAPSVRRSLPFTYCRIFR